MSASIERFGEAALVLTVEAAVSIENQRRIGAVARDARAWAGVVDAVPGAGNLTLIADPRSDFPALRERLLEAWHASVASALEPARLVRIPVRYGGDCGPDLPAVAAAAGLSESDAVARHAARDYAVLFLGFLPGFAYLGGLDPRLVLPRRSEPRSAVEAGSVAIGSDMTGIYPFRSPGGWHVIGRTDATLFDAGRTPPALLAPGDRVVFVPVP